VLRRPPTAQIDDNVLISACATVLGNIRVGKGAQIAAGSLVLKPVPAHTLVAGSPAKEVCAERGGRAAHARRPHAGPAPGAAAKTHARCRPGGMCSRVWGVPSG
jgi:serine acetyltransferase